jgi:hypothetical protein
MTAFANFPYEVVEASGENALATWEELRNAGRGVPVVLGEDNLDNLLLPFDPRERARQKSVEEILAMAEAIDFPDGLHKLRRDEHAAAVAYFKKMGSAADFGDEESEAPLGDWPAEPWCASGLSVTYDFATQRTKPTAHIALIPSDDPTAIPAYMHWGNWNECPPPAYHVAALRAWRDHYGAELIASGPIRSTCAYRAGPRHAKRPSTSLAHSTSIVTTSSIRASAPIGRWPPD